MVILYQVAIFAIIILSSFAGFKGLFISVCLIVGFSLSNIFTAQLLVIQFTTIVVSTVIGVIIATIKLILNMPRIINDKFNSIKEYFQEYRLIAREWLRPSQGPPGVLKFSSGKLKLKAKCSNYEYLAF